MEQKTYRVLSSERIGGEGVVVFTGCLFDLKKRFPVSDYPIPLSQHRTENPRGNITFYFTLKSLSENKEWVLELQDPRFD